MTGLGETSLGLVLNLHDSKQVYGETSALCIAPFLTLKELKQVYGRGSQCLVRCPSKNHIGLGLK